LLRFKKKKMSVSLCVFAASADSSITDAVTCLWTAWPTTLTAFGAPDGEPGQVADDLGQVNANVDIRIFGHTAAGFSTTPMC
jgi:hypothetical protein